MTQSQRIVFTRSMEATTQFGLAAFAPHSVRLVLKTTLEPTHPITNDVAANEAAMIVLFRASLHHAKAHGTLPEHDVAAAGFHRDHGSLAAVIRDPINEAFHMAGSILAKRLDEVLPREERANAAARPQAGIRTLRRYADDTRSRH